MAKRAGASQQINQAMFSHNHAHRKTTAAAQVDAYINKQRQKLKNIGPGYTLEQQAQDAFGKKQAVYQQAPKVNG